MSDAKSPIPFDGALIASIGAVAAVAVVLSIGAVFVSGWLAAAGVAVGGLFATLNLYAFGHIAKNVLAGGRKKRVWGLLGGLKFIVLLGIIAVLVVTGVISGVAFAVGYVSLPIGIAIGAYLGPREDDDDVLNAGPQKHA